MNALHTGMSLFLLTQVVLDSHSFSDMTARSNYLIHGDGKSFWFDKSFNAVVFSDGRSGLNCEHSWGDAPVMAYISEYNLTEE